MSIIYKFSLTIMDTEKISDFNHLILSIFITLKSRFTSKCMDFIHEINQKCVSDVWISYKRVSLIKRNYSLKERLICCAKFKILFCDKFVAKPSVKFEPNKVAIS